jgi:transposase
MNEKQERVKYTKEFKEDAVKLVTEQGYSANEAGRRLGVGQSNISRWVREFRKEQQDGAEGEIPRKELEAEVKRLRKENKRLQMEREILKKAAAFFAKESN